MSEGIPCPECGVTTSAVIDSRPASEPLPNTRRRRRCPNGHRFTTVEVLADTRFGSLLDPSMLPEDQRQPFRELFNAMVRRG